MLEKLQIYVNYVIIINVIVQIFRRSKYERKSKGFL